jgi:cytochrome c biogenesis protein CcdA
MMRKITVSALFLFFFTFGIFAAGQSISGKPKIIFFYSNSCQECIKVKTEFIPKIYEKFRDGIEEIDYRDIADIENYKFFLGLKKQYGVSRDLKVPVIFFVGNFLSGRDSIVHELDGLLESSLKKPGIREEKISSFDLLAHFLSFTLMAVVSAGLIDGINPCAFTVIVFFISFLALEGYKKRELIVIGFSFILAVFLTYLLIGLGLFGFFYCLKGFWLVRRIVNLAIGLFSIILGFFAVSDFFKYKRTAQTEGMSLQLPQAVKNRIHAVITGHYRRTKDASQLEHKAMFSLILTAFITGLLVSILEAVCTGQTYLPTISFILKTTPMKLAALGYLILYNLMFVVPLLLIFLFALLGVTSEQFSQFLKKHFLTTKILMAVLFFSLGILLIWKG